MQTVQSRIYTNVILTAIAVLLAVLAFRPAFTTSAWAQDAEEEDTDRPRVRINDDASERAKRNLAEFGIAKGDEELAKATEAVAKSNREIADAIRETGNNQAEALLQVAKALMAAEK